MNTDELKLRLNEYFEYIKTIYLNEFSKYMNDKTRDRITNMTNVIELNSELSFKVSVTDKLTFNLNLPKYIEENRLKDNSSLSDLNEHSINYINYLVQNESTVFEVVKNKMLEKVITLFTQNKHDVVTIGTINMICSKLVEKYNFPSENILESKESEVARYIRKIVGEDTLLSSVINNEPQIIEEVFDSYSPNTKYEEFRENINNKYNEYHKKVGRIFLPDSLYEYENLDYKLEKNLSKVEEEKHNDNINRVKRISSIKMALLNMRSHKILFNTYEQRVLEAAIAEIDKVLHQIMPTQNQLAIDIIDKEYTRVIEIEKEIQKLSSRIWSNSLTSLDSYSNGSNFNFLVSTHNDTNPLEARLISSEMLENIKNLDLGYGFILEPIEGSILCASSKDFNYKKVEDKLEYNTTDESILLTPNMIINKNIKNKNIDNKILLNPRNVYITGIYCSTDDDLENSSNYLKAQELSEDYNLPIITINVKDYSKHRSMKVA